MDDKLYTLTGASGHPYLSPVKGAWGGHRLARVYGLLSCRAAARALALGGYRANRVFFADEDTAVAAGYRPCAACLPEAYAGWKASRTAAAPASWSPPSPSSSSSAA